MMSAFSKAPAVALTAMLASSSLANSGEGKLVASFQRKTAEHLRATNTIGRTDLHAELAAIAQSCQEPDWDGYGAMRIDDRSVAIAHRLIDSLPPASPRVLFSVAADPDGQVSFEWHKSPAWTLSVSISPVSDAHYSALLGPSSLYGTEALGVPARWSALLLDLIQRVEVA